MNELQELSGPWSGFWIQSQIRGYMRLRLQFSGPQLAGGGSDCAGHFEIRGALNSVGIVSFAKAYPTHIVHYEGHWDGRMIAGLWTMRHPVVFGHARFFEEKGDFEIWPEVGESESISDLIQETEVRALTA
jgi:hypothetical protein